MKTIAQRWTEFEAQVISPDAGPVQRQEMRRAFYAGFNEALVASLQMAEESGNDDELGVAMMESLHRECREFVSSVLTGRA